MSRESASLPDTTEPMAAVRHYIESFNEGDVKAMAAMCAVPMSILDGLAPHVWHVPTSMSFKIRGQHVTQSGALFTLALHKLNKGRRIAAWGMG